jgi:hypothetical protein
MSTGETSVSLTDLPLEVTDYIIRFLTPKDLCKFSRVDKLIYSMTTAERLWSEWLATRWNIDNIKPFRPQLLINYKRKKDLYGVLDKISSPVVDFAYRTYQEHKNFLENNEWSPIAANHLYAFNGVTSKYNISNDRRVFTILVEATVDVPCERIAKKLRKPINHSRWDGALGEVREIDYLQKDTKLVLFTYPPGPYLLTFHTATDEKGCEFVTIASTIIDLDVLVADHPQIIFHANPPYTILPCGWCVQPLEKNKSLIKYTLRLDMHDLVPMQRVVWFANIKSYVIAQFANELIGQRPKTKDLNYPPDTMNDN